MWERSGSLYPPGKLILHQLVPAQEVPTGTVLWNGGILWEPSSHHSLPPFFLPQIDFDTMKRGLASPAHTRALTLSHHTHTLSPSKVFLYWSSHHSILALQLRLVILPGVLHDSSNWCVNMMSEFLPLYDLRRQFKCVWCRFLIVPMLISWMRSPFFLNNQHMQPVNIQKYIPWRHFRVLPVPECIFVIILYGLAQVTTHCLLHHNKQIGGNRLLFEARSQSENIRNVILSWV